MTLTNYTQQNSVRILGYKTFGQNTSSLFKYFVLAASLNADEFDDGLLKAYDRLKNSESVEEAFVVPKSERKTVR
jgi:hypothetical protein